MAPPSAFSYTSLTPGHIRLLRIEPSGGSDDIRCRFVEHCLVPREAETQAPAGRSHPYTAVSYTWETDPDSSTGTQPTTTKMGQIRVESQHMAVRENLWWFLASVGTQRRYRDLLFWIDAVCINQKDLAEKSSQVRMMGSIYQGAHELFVWLGNPGPRDPAALLGHVKRLQMSKIQAHEDAADRLVEETSFQALKSLFQRAYWSRAWIVQEVCLAAEIQLFVGPDCVAWSDVLDFRRGVSWLLSLTEDGKGKMYDPRPLKELLRVMQRSVVPLMASRGRLVSSSSRPSWLGLEDCLRTHNQSRCADPRDRVYSLLSLIPKAATGEYEVEVDYASPVAKVTYAALASRESRPSVETLRTVKYAQFLQTVLHVGYADARAWVRGAQGDRSPPVVSFRATGFALGRITYVYEVATEYLTTSLPAQCKAVDIAMGRLVVDLNVEIGQYRVSDRALATSGDNEMSPSTTLCRIRDEFQANFIDTFSTSLSCCSLLSTYWARSCWETVQVAAEADFHTSTRRSWPRRVESTIFVLREGLRSFVTRLQHADLTKVSERPAEDGLPTVPSPSSSPPAKPETHLLAIVGGWHLALVAPQTQIDDAVYVFPGSRTVVVARDVPGAESNRVVGRAVASTSYEDVELDLRYSSTSHKDYVFVQDPLFLRRTEFQLDYPTLLFASELVVHEEVKETDSALPPSIWMTG